jgi:hypothetical protein
MPKLIYYDNVNVVPAEIPRSGDQPFSPPGVNVTKCFYSSLMLRYNKLERLSLARYFILLIPNLALRVSIRVGIHKPLTSFLLSIF